MRNVTALSTLFTYQEYGIDVLVESIFIIKFLWAYGTIMFP